MRTEIVTIIAQVTGAAQGTPGLGPEEREREVQARSNDKGN